MAGYVTYLRVSTQKQGQSGLGLSAQRAAVASYNAVAEYVDVETGKADDRVELAKALRHCRVYGCTLVIAKLDRLSRNRAFLLTLLDSAGFEIVAADMPHANRLTIGIMAVVSEAEREMISERTKAALKAAKARGVVLGGYHGVPPSDAAREASRAVRGKRASDRAADILPIVRELQAAGIVSLNGIARALTERRIPKARGGLSWCAADVKTLLAHAA